MPRAKQLLMQTVLVADAWAGKTDFLYRSSAMVNYFYLDRTIVRMESGENPDVKDVFWVDLISPTTEEKRQVEHDFRVELFTKQESEEIESSSKYVETEDEIGINLNFLVPEEGTFSNEPVSFIIKDKILFTQRNLDFRTFSETYRKLRTFKPVDGDDIFLTILVYLAIGAIIGAFIWKNRNMGDFIRKIINKK